MEGKMDFNQYIKDKALVLDNTKISITEVVRFLQKKHTHYNAFSSRFRYW